MTDENANAIKIAVIEEQIRGLRDQSAAHQRATQTNFETLGGKVDELIAVMNRGKGAYAASLALAGALGAALLGIANMLMNWMHK